MSELIYMVKDKNMNRIDIGGTSVLEINLDSGWEIGEIRMPDDIPASMINNIVVTFRKKGINQ